MSESHSPRCGFHFCWVQECRPRRGTNETAKSKAFLAYKVRRPSFYRDVISRNTSRDVTPGGALSLLGEPLTFSPAFPSSYQCSTLRSPMHSFVKLRVGKNILSKPILYRARKEDNTLELSAEACDNSQENMLT